MITTKIFKNRLVKNLAWVIASPPLVSGNHASVHWWSADECSQEFKDCLPALLVLDKNPEPLLRHLSQLKSGRLGLRFESYISYWLRISPNYRQLKQNIQIIEEGHTYGELDFIIEDIHTQKIIHLEVAVKFYLGRLIDNEASENPYEWFGTNTSDQLGKKLDHLKEHQTQLTSKFEKHLQKKLGFHIDEKQCLLKGRLFYPMKSNTPPVGVNQNHLRGRWIKAEKPIFLDKSFVAIDKEYWLAELEKNEIGELPNQQGLTPIKRAQCYVRLNVNSNKDYQEIERMFHLPDDFWEFSS